MRSRTCWKVVRCAMALLAGWSLLAVPHRCWGSQASPTVSSAKLELSSPLDNEVFQRRTRDWGEVIVHGKAPLPASRIEARLTGTSAKGPLPARWKKLHLNRATGEFTGKIHTPAGGFYELEVRELDHATVAATTTVPHVGVGEVFVICGQSNSTNYGETKQTTQTGMVMSFDGSSWQIANDPQPGVQDHSKKGSFIPPFGDELYRRYHVPIGIASVGHGSTSVRQWLPAGDSVEVMPTMTKFVTRRPDGVLISDGTLFNGLMKRINQLGPHGFRAVLWHQGEPDSHQPPGHDISADTYRTMLTRVIQSTRRQAGWKIPWFVAEASYHTPKDPRNDALRAAQASLWRNGVALEGPDTDTLTAAYRQNNGKGVHFNDAGLKAHGHLWAQQVEAYLDRVLR